jgi:type I restriction enzyme S subunit
MSFPKYEAYKNSYCERLGVVPEHWTILPCRAFVDECNQKNTNGSITEYLSLMAHIGVIRYEDKGDIGNKKPDDLSKCKIVRKGNLVINSMNYGIGSYGLSDIDGVCSPVYIVLQPKNEAVLERYALRIFEEKEFQSWAQSFGNGILAHRCAIRWDDLKNIKIALPPLFEQTQIARFLDHETARIDALIAEQERLIELLREKRQAVISHAVTKGLDPTAPMKDSGVEWLGEVPEHWKVTRLKFITDRIVDCPHETPVYNPEGDYLVIRTADIDQGVLMPEQMYRLDEEEYLNRIRREPLLQNDIVYGREGERWGHAALIPTSNLFALGQRMMQFRAANEACPLFLMFQLNSVSTYRQGEVDTVGATSPHVNISTIRNYQVVMPPLDEQKQISRYLQQISEALDSLIEEAANTSNILQERRSALISAAVTGKIDVRDWQPPASAAPAAPLEAACG